MKLTLLLASLAALAVGYRLRDARKRQREAAIDGFLGQMRAVVASPVVTEQRLRDAIGRTGR